MFRKYLLLLYLLVLLLVSTGLSETATKSRMPILNYLHAPVVAELDITSVKNELKGYIDIQVHDQVNQTWNAEIKTIVSDKLLNLKSDMLEEFLYSLNETRQSFDVQLNTLLERFTVQFKLLEQNLKLENQNLIRHLIEENEAWKQKLLKEKEGKLLLKDDIPTSTQKTEYGYLEYALMFTQPVYPDKTQPIVYLFSTEYGTVHITNKNQSIQIQKGQNMILLDKSIFTTDGVEKKVVHIISSVPVTIYGFQRYNGSCDGYLAIPTKRMSKKYVVPSFTNYQNDEVKKSLMGIMSLNTHTVINVKLKLKDGFVSFKDRKYKNYETITVQMSEFESLQLSNTFDLSGSVITSSHPIGIVSGNKCNYIKGVGACNLFTEMVLPTDQLDNAYIVPVIQSRSQSTIRVLCPNRATVTIYARETIYRNLEEGDFFDFYHSDVSFIRSKGDVLVMMYPFDQDNGRGDSYMMTIIGLHQYKSEYDFIVPEGFQSSISITFVGKDEKGFEIDNKPISPSKLLTKIVDNTTYYTFSYVVADGSHSIKHSSNITFGLWVYGTRWFDGYGFPAGIAYRQN